ncbi:MAG: hypothetical protein RLZZ230_694 [Candidatus Parcubacteria bacterium]|jgi:hypothetical protein
MFSSHQKTQTIHKIFTTFVIVFLLSWSFPVAACGCGILIMSSDTEAGWEYGNDTTEQALIAYDDGIEHLLIGLDIKSRDTSAVLVIPIPSSPDQVNADIISDAPEFSGYDVVEKAKDELEDIKSSLLATQIYPIVGEFFSQSTFGLSKDSISIMVPNQGIFSEVDVYQHIEKEGMIAEVLSAQTSDALYQYLSEKGLQVEKDSIPIFSDYIRDDFSFVVAWIDPAKDHLTAQGVTMSFPTDEIFYPLKPNSAYSGMSQQKNIIVFGYTNPQIYQSIEADTVVEYKYSEEGLKFHDFINTEDGFGYTQITIYGVETQSMQEDLRISNTAPMRISFAHRINMNPIIFTLGLLIILSFVATWLAIRITRPQYQGVKPKLYRLVVLNCLTIIGTIFSANRYLKTRKFMYIAVFSILFVIATLITISSLTAYITN